MPMVSDRVLEYAQDSFRGLINDLLDDPSWLLHPDRDLEPGEQIAEYRQLATDLGLDYDILVAETRPMIDELPKRFAGWAKQWHDETDMLSSTSKKIGHGAYQIIIAMGRRAPQAIVPLILNEMRERPAFWFYALELITNEPSKGTDVATATHAWLEWGKDITYQPVYDDVEHTRLADIESGKIQPSPRQTA